MYLFELMSSFSLGKYPKVESMGYMVFLFLVFWGMSVLLSTVAAPIHSHQQHRGIPFSPHPCQNLWFLVFWIVAVLTGMRWYLVVVLIFIYLMIGDVEHLFVCLLAICISSLKSVCSGRPPVFHSGCFFGVGSFEFFLCFAC